MKIGEPPHFKKQSTILLSHKAVKAKYKSRHSSLSYPAIGNGFNNNNEVITKNQAFKQWRNQSRASFPTENPFSLNHCKKGDATFLTGAYPFGLEVNPTLERILPSLNTNYNLQARPKTLVRSCKF